MILTRRIEEAEWPAWDSFVENAQGGTIQHQTFWLRLAGKTCHCNPIVWGVFKGRELIGGCALLEDASASSAKVAPCTQYNGLVFADSKSTKAYRQEKTALVVEEALAKELENYYRSVVMTNHPFIRDVRPFIWAGWNVDICYDYFWDMSDPDTIQQSMHHDVRRQLKIAESNGLQVRISHEWEKVFDLWKLSFGHKGLRLRLDPGMIGYWYEEMAKKNMAMTYLAETGGRAVAGLTVVKGKKTLYLWFNGLNSEYRKLGANTLLMWKAMLDHRYTHKLFDLCGGDVAGVAAYKSSLGAHLVPHYRVSFHSNI
ncbi:GNAT family N-acetyltransferase [Thermodesulfobacteriota bacterium]